MVSLKAFSDRVPLDNFFENVMTGTLAKSSWDFLWLIWIWELCRRFEVVEDWKLTEKA